MLRFIIMVLYLIPVYLISLPLWVYHYFLRKVDPMKSAKQSQRFVAGALSGIVRLSGSEITILGQERVPQDTPVLYVGNHKSIFDIVIGYSYVKNNTGFVGKDSLETTPLIGRWLKYCNGLFMNRKDIKEGLKTILHGIELVKAGTSIFIFPEGTRSDTDELLPFKEGSLKIAEKSGCPVVPVAITNTDAIFENQFPKIRRTHVIIEFGEPIDLKSLEKEQRRHCGAYVRDIIIDMRAEHQNIIAKSDK